MNRERIFGFRVNDDDRRILAALAERLQRTESDALRWLIRNAARELAIEITRKQPRVSQRNATAA